MASFSQDLPTNGREKYEWETKYKLGADGKNPAKLMLREAIYLLILMLAAFVGIIVNYVDGFIHIIHMFCVNINTADTAVIKKIIYCLCAGLLGGVTFSIKIFYRAVARGEWNYDRRYWRFFSPLISLSVTTLVAAFMMDDIISSKTYIAYALGYFGGYFSEHAVGKMYDIATVLFSSPQTFEDRKESKEREEATTGKQGDGTSN